MTIGTLHKTSCSGELHDISVFSRQNVERLLDLGYVSVPSADRLRRHRTTVLHNGAHYMYEGDDGLCWLEETIALTTTEGVYAYHCFSFSGVINVFNLSCTRPWACICKDTYYSYKARLQGSVGRLFLTDCPSSPSSVGSSSTLLGFSHVAFIYVHTLSPDQGRGVSCLTCLLLLRYGTVSPLFSLYFRFCLVLPTPPVPFGGSPAILGPHTGPQHCMLFEFYSFL